jgi:hypothetical protein
MGQMAFTGLAVAARAAAFFAEGYQAGGDKRAVGLEFLNASQEMAADEGGMLWNFHEGERIANQGAGITDTYIYVTDKASKNHAAKK